MMDKHYSNPPLDITNAMAWHLLRRTNVWIWDTVTIMRMKESQACLDHVRY